MLSFNEALVLAHLKNNGTKGSTDIGLAIGGISMNGRQRLSEWASPILKCLARKGLVERYKNRKYKAK